LGKQIGRNMYIELNDEFVEIDDQIVCAIIELNQKGYKTLFCCSGHNDKESSSAYIMFAKSFIEKYGMPVGWDIDNKSLLSDPIRIKKFDKTFINRCKRTIRFDLGDFVETKKGRVWRQMKKSKEKQAAIDNAMKSLRDWVEGLPKISK
jgi:hypothetical protein